MLEDTHPLLQTFLGTLFTWGMTALGAALVFVFKSNHRKVLDGSLGFAAGVMTAASYWSLLAPAIEMAESSGNYGSEGKWAFLPASIGFLLGALFVFSTDLLIPSCTNLIQPGSDIMADQTEAEKKYEESNMFLLTVQDDGPGISSNTDATRQRRPYMSSSATANGPSGIKNLSPSAPGRIESSQSSNSEPMKNIKWRRILLLIIAITIHNIPEGLAVGVGFGAIGKTKSATIENARNLAFGIGIQNFPEGLAVSLPLRGSGMSPLKCFWYGQLSGMVEPIAGLLGAVAVAIAEPILPYALAFAAGAMIFVVMDDIIPEAQVGGNGKLASWGGIVGFVVMMSLDVGLG